MTQTLTTEAIQEIYEAAVHEEVTGGDQDAGFELLCKLEDVGGTGATIRKLIDMVRAANREAQPVADEIYAELYRLRIENKGPNGFETWRDAAIFERTRRADAERKLNGEEMTYLEAMSLLTTDDAQNLSAIEAFRRGASYNGKINAHALRNSMRYQLLRDKDAWGCDNEPGLVEWDGLIELEGNDFDAAIDARMANSDVTPFTAPPAPAVTGDLLEAMAEVIRISDRDHEAWDRAKNAITACRAAMLAQPVSQGYNWIACSEKMPEPNKYVQVSNGVWVGIGMYSDADHFEDDERWQDEHNEFIDLLHHPVTHWMPLPAASEITPIADKRQTIANEMNMGSRLTKHRFSLDNTTNNTETNNNE